MAERLGEALLELSTTDRGFQQGLREAQRSAQSMDREFSRVQRSIESHWQRLGRAARALTSGPLAQLAAGFGLTQLARSVFAVGLETDQLQRQLKFASGGAVQAQADFAFLRAEAERLGLDFRTAARAFAGFSAAARGTSLEGQGVRDVFTAVAEASTVMGLSAENTQGIMLALQQIMSKGIVAAEELRGQIGERLFGAFEIAARAVGTTTQALGKMLQQGEVVADEFLRRFARELRQTVAGDLPEAVTSATTQVNRFTNAWRDLLTAVASSGAFNAAIGLLNQLRTGLEQFGVIGVGPMREMARELEDLLAKRQRLQALSSQSFVQVDPTGQALARIGQELEAVNAKIQETRRRMIDLGKAENAPRLPPVVVTAPGPSAATAAASSATAAQKAAQADLEAFVTESNARLAAIAEERAQQITSVFEQTRTPLEQFTAEVQRLQALQAQGLDVDTFGRAIGQAATELGRATPALQAWNAEQERGRQLTESLRTPQELYNDSIRELVELFQGAAIGGETFDRGVAAAANSLQDATAQTHEMSTAAHDLGLTFSSAFEEAVLGANRFSEVLQGLLQDLARIALRLLIMQPLIEALGGTKTIPGLLSGLGTAIRGLFGFQHGGSFTVGGSGAPDSQLVAFRASPGEQVTVA
ncbi:MAG: tape measure protein, partial [Candidatus Rokuibacteriota bacterium]